MRRIRFSLAPLAAALLASLPAGCSGKAAPENVLLGAAGAVHEGVLGWQSITDDTVRLASTGIVDVDIEVFAGEVRVVADPTVKETRVTVRRTGTHGWLRERESMDSLGEIHYTVSLDHPGERDRAVVRAGTDHPEPHFQATEVTVVVPDLGAVRVLTARGDVWIEGNRRGVEVKSTRGQIRLMTPWQIVEPISLVTTEGDVDLRLRGESTGAFDAETVGGVIKSKVKYGKWIAMHNENDADTLHATMNGGTNPITLRTSNADVMISVVPMPVTQNPAPAIW